MIQVFWDVRLSTGKYFAYVWRSVMPPTPETSCRRRVQLGMLHSEEEAFFCSNISVTDY
jgi:hypothetical protein